MKYCLVKKATSLFVTGSSFCLEKLSNASWIVVCAACPMSPSGILPPGDNPLQDKDGSQRAAGFIASLILLFS
jgi:hypothetical protein